MISVAHGNNTTDTYTYDARSEKLSQVLTASNVSGTLQQKIYYYTAIGEISAILNMPSPGWLGYTYDKLGRLTNEYTNGTSSMTITYNAIGNITSKTVGGNTFTYSYSADHKHAVCSVTYNGSIYPYFYDSNGNMTYGPDFTNLGNIQARTITYNADNMPVQLSYSSGVTTQFTYGGTGERVKKRVNSGGNVTDTYYIGDHFEVRGGETIKYIFAGNLRVAQVKGSTRSFFHKDHLGSSTVMTDASGYVIESTEYMPFGSVRSHSGASTSDYKYTDQELDAENGLYNYNARLYDPFIGRFISPDTIVPDTYNPQSLNRYSYCLNNPIIYTDPSGHTYADADEWAAYMAIAQQAYSLYQVWPQMGGIMLHDFLMGFNSFQTGFEVRAVDPDTMILAQLLAGTQASGGGQSSYQNSRDPNEIDKVAKAKLSEGIQITKIFGYEIGGLIYEFKGSYYATPWVNGHTHKTQPNPHVHVYDARVYMPDGANIVGIYHTHPNNNVFSSGDVDLANDKLNSPYGIYMGYVSGDVWFYESDSLDLNPQYVPEENYSVLIGFTQIYIGKMTE